MLEEKESLRVPPSEEAGGCSSCPHKLGSGSSRARRNEGHRVPGARVPKKSRALNCEDFAPSEDTGGYNVGGELWVSRGWRPGMLKNTPQQGLGCSLAVEYWPSMH